MAEAAERQGAPTAPLGGTARRAAVPLLTILPLLCALLAGAAPAAQSADSAQSETTHAVSARHTADSTPVRQASTPKQSPTSLNAPAGRGARTIDISIDNLDPAVPEPGDTLTISGSATNTGKSTVQDGQVDVQLGPAMNSRSAIHETSGSNGPLRNAGSSPDGEQSTRVDGLAPGVSRSFTLKIPVNDLGLDDNGVYALSVNLTGQTKAKPYDRILGSERSFLPWQTSTPQEKTQLTYMWPLISSSHLTARTESNEQQTSVFRNDDLEQAIAPGGRLQQLVALGADLPITWVVDPDLLASVEAMTQPYEVRTEDGRTKPGKAQANAKQWLKDLQEAVDGEEIVALPFADPDLASLAHQGQQVPGALGRLRPATELARDTVEAILHTQPNTDFAWPVEGAVDASVVGVATSAGASNVIARSDSMGERGRIPYTPTAARPIGGGATAVVADHRLSTAFDGDLTRAGKSTRAVQRFLAETLSITQQVPNEQRSVVVAPQRQPTVSQARTMAETLEALDSDGRWTTGTSMSDAARADPDPSARRTVPGRDSYPAALRKQELPTEAFEQVQKTQHTLDNFSEVLSREDRVVAPFGNAIEREISNSWRGEAEQAEHFRGSVQDYLLGLTKEVHLIQKSDLTLSGRSATIPVTVQNNLVQGVDGLVLRLESSRSIGMEVGEAQSVVVDGGHSQSVKFDTTAKANGRTTVTAQLYTKDGKPYGPPMTFQVKVTSITSTVLLVIAGGVLLVVLAGIRMYTQRKRRGGTETEPADPDAAPEDGGDASGPSEPGDGGDPEDPTTPEGATQDTTEEDPEGPPDASESERNSGGTGTTDRAMADVQDGSVPTTQEAAADDPGPRQAGERGKDTATENGGPSDTSEKVER